MWSATGARQFFLQSLTSNYSQHDDFEIRIEAEDNYSVICIVLTG